MRFSAILFILFMAMCLPGICQSILTINTNNPQNSDSIYISVWENGLQKQLTASYLIEGKTKIVLPENLPHGMMMLRFTGKSLSFNYMLIYSGESILFAITEDQVTKSQSFEISGQTKLFNQYHLQIDSFNNRIMRLSTLNANFNNDKEFVHKINSHLSEVISDRKAFFAMLRQQHGSEVFAHMLYPLEFFVPDHSLTPRDQQKEILSHFFDHYDPTDQLILNSTIPEDRIIDYFNIAYKVAEPGNEKQFIELIDRYFKQLKHSDILISASVSIVQKWLATMGYDLTREYLDKQYLANQCNAEGDFNLQKRLAGYERTQIGKIAPDFTWQAGLNENQLSALNASKIVIIFWATWCSHCKDLIPLIEVALEDKKDVSVIAIALDADEKTWYEQTRTIPGWKHVRAAGIWKDPLVDLYGVTGTPSMFILDQNKIITAKAKNVAELLEAIK